MLPGPGTEGWVTVLEIHASEPQIHGWLLMSLVHPEEQAFTFCRSFVFRLWKFLVLLSKAHNC